MNNLEHSIHLRFTEITKTVGKRKNRRTILDKVDIELKSGECTLISGKNGSGKSTLLRIMAGLLKPDSAYINTGLESKPWNKIRKVIQHQVMYLYQEPYMFDGSVRQNLAYAANSTQFNNKLAKERISDALAWAGLTKYSETQAKCLSGGEKQRVALAQAWLKKAPILLLDEPTANMDNDARERTEELLSSLKKSGTALFIASHDPNHFRQITDKRLLLENAMIQTIHDSKSFDDSGNITVFPNKMKKSKTL